MFHLHNVQKLSKNIYLSLDVIKLYKSILKWSGYLPKGLCTLVVIDASLAFPMAVYADLYHCLYTQISITSSLGHF